jgi:hypothetical protein
MAAKKPTVKIRNFIGRSMERAWRPDTLSSWGINSRFQLKEITLKPYRVGCISRRRQHKRDQGISQKLSNAYERGYAVALDGPRSAKGRCPEACWELKWRQTSPRWKYRGAVRGASRREKDWQEQGPRASEGAAIFAAERLCAGSVERILAFRQSQQSEQVRSCILTPRRCRD